MKDPFLGDQALKNAANNVGALLEVTEEPETLAFVHVDFPAEYAICADIWLQASIVGQLFIDKEFWKGNLQAMAEHYLPASIGLLAYDEGIPVASTQQWKTGWRRCLYCLLGGVRG